MTTSEFEEKIVTILAKDTSADPDNWSPQNPFWGHCAIVSLLAQDYFGGTLMRGSLTKMPHYEHLRSHFWNQLPDKREIDFTADQYKDFSFYDLIGEPRDRERVLRHPDTQRRYTLLKKRFESVL